MSPPDRHAESGEPNVASPVVDVTTDDREPADESARDQFFDTSHLTSDLKGRAVRGGALTMGGQVAGRVIQIGSTMVLARILTPQDYGLIAMITVVTEFGSQFKDLGLSVATVQRDKITHEQISTLFWVNLVLGIVVMCAMMAFSPAIAWFYGEPRLMALTLFMSAGFVSSGLTVQHQALLRRQMRFKALAVIDVAKAVVGVAIGILAALSGAGVWALALMPVARSLFGGAAVWLICPWRPSRPKRGTGVRGMLAFGGKLSGFNVATFFARNVDNVLIGRVLGGAALGFYTKAYGLLLLPLQQITAPIRSVAIPTLSRILDEPERYRRYFCKALNGMAVIIVPVVCVLVVMAPPLIYVMLGPQWSPVTRIFQFLAMAALLEPITESVYWILMSAGQTGRLFYWRAITLPVLVISFVVGLPWGTLGVATAFSTYSLLLILPTVAYGTRHSPVGFWEFLGAIRRPFIWGAALMGAGFVGNTAAEGNEQWGFLGGLFAMAVLGAVLLLVWPQARQEIRDCVGLLKGLRSTR